MAIGCTDFAYFWDAYDLVTFLGSIYLTLSIAIERYTTVCHPFFKVSYLYGFFNFHTASNRTIWFENGSYSVKNNADDSHGIILLNICHQSASQDLQTFSNTVYMCENRTLIKKE